MSIVDVLRSAWVSAKDTIEINYVLSDLYDVEIGEDEACETAHHNSNCVDRAGYGCQRTAVDGRTDPDTGELWGKSVK